MSKSAFFFFLLTQIAAAWAASFPHHHHKHKHAERHQTVAQPFQTSDQVATGTSLQLSSAVTATKDWAAEAASTEPSSASGRNLTSSADSNFIRGINIGGWLLLEKSFNGKLFSGNFEDAIDQWTFDSISGAGAALEQHWASYFTEEHVTLLKSYGINAFRISIGFWAYDASGTPYYSQGIGKGADGYLEKAIGWAKTAGMKVWVDLHGLPGSQNGEDHSGHKGTIGWQLNNNTGRAISILSRMAEKYGAAEYAGTVIGLELANEPKISHDTPLSFIQQFAKDAFAPVKAKAATQDMAIVMQDGYAGPAAWVDVAKSLGPKGSFVIDTHLYQLFTPADRALTQAQHIQKVCTQGAAMAAAGQEATVVVGEWTAGTPVCVNPDGSSTPGNTCSVSGCACVSGGQGEWTPALIDQMRRFVEAQLEIFEAYTAGYFLWTWTDPTVEMGSWSVTSLANKGILPTPLNDLTKRKYPNQCKT